MKNNSTAIIATLGPSTRTEGDLRVMKQKGVDFVRCNMSHSSLEELEYFLDLASRVGIPFIIDTQGSQVRTGPLAGGPFAAEENDEIRLHVRKIVGGSRDISLTPSPIVSQLEEGDMLYLGFDTLILRVSDCSTMAEGYVVAHVVRSGLLEANKGVVIDSVMGRKRSMPSLTDKDRAAIALGVRNGVGHVAASFVRSKACVDEVRHASDHAMQVISKIECVDALKNLDEIINASDYLLIDRGDLSKEVAIERIPFLQKIIIARAAVQKKGVFVATNLLESMVTQKTPTRAEAHDVIATILDGAMGLTLAAETAIGKNPIECVNTLNRLIYQAETVLRGDAVTNSFLQDRVSQDNYIHSTIHTDSLSALPHGGILVDRIVKTQPSEAYLSRLPTLEISKHQQVEVEQIANGTLSPLKGFMIEEDVHAVLDTMRLSNGIAWPLPIVLDVSREESSRFSIGEEIGLTDASGVVVAIFRLEDRYEIDAEMMAEKLYGTSGDSHPGVRLLQALKPIFFGGPIALLKRRSSWAHRYELTPRQARGLFERRGWSTVVGFHTRNVIHRAHEHIQLEALEKTGCDGLFVHPVVGEKKKGDFQAAPIIHSYEMMMRRFYPRDKVVFSVFPTFSRYAGPREAIFTAICRKNFGCSHFIVGRDHAGVGDFYSPHASQEIFEQFPDLGITPVFFDKVGYSKEQDCYLSETEETDTGDTMHISGTEARDMFERGEMPPAWHMRPEIAQLILDSKKNGEQIFV